ncbi:MAG: amidohydrolase, partial [Candidatus Woesearchaeota archaeon]|nr:amidohydrolase [Candidatus Woesearchaeota archaeon]
MGKEYDLLLKGGTLIDPGSETYGQKDLAIKQGRIASVRTYISENHAYKVIDVSGLHVMPGLIDLHVHCYPPSPWTGDGFVEDAFCSQTGVTYAVDAGTTGAGNFELFRDNFIIPSTTRLKAYVHIANVGLSGPEKHGESMDLKHLDPEATAAMILANPDYTIGVKVRQAELQVGDSGLEPLRLAIRAAEIANCHVMVHIGGGTDLEEALDMLRPGDVVTHCCHGG